MQNVPCVFVAVPATFLGVPVTAPSPILLPAQTPGPVQGAFGQTPARADMDSEDEMPPAIPMHGDNGRQVGEGWVFEVLYYQVP